MIRLAGNIDLLPVVNFYNDLIESMQHSPIDIGWRTGIYPSQDMLSQAISEKTLFILVEDNDILGAMILNHSYTEGYEQIDWKFNGPKSELIVIHALGISTNRQGKGLANKLMKFAISYAQENKILAIRLDVLKKNIPAQKLYERFGFKYRGSMDLFYENTGLTHFYLYEKLL